MRELSDRQQEKIDYEREQMIYKSNQMIQKGRHDLTIWEQRAVIYAISKIKPTDSAFTEYIFSFDDFYKVCGIKQSYDKLAVMLAKLSDRGWWLTLDNGEKSRVRWFTTLRMNENKRQVTIKFHEDMMPYLLELVKRGILYTKYKLIYILPMKSEYGPRLYELIKSYSNNPIWWMSIDELKERLNADNYTKWYDFKRRCLEPAMNDINNCSDLIFDYELEKEGREYKNIKFIIKQKSKKELTQTIIADGAALDG